MKLKIGKWSALLTVLLSSSVFALDASFWASGATNTAGDNCAQANVGDGKWDAASCTDSKPVVCFSGANWYLTASTVSMSNYAAAQNACDTEFGGGVNFIAPSSVAQSNALAAVLGASGLNASTDLWVNGNRIADGATWQWSITDTQIPKWDFSNAQPDGGVAENCAAITNASDATWLDADCAGSLPYACYNTSADTWHLTAGQVL